MYHLTYFYPPDSSNLTFFRSENKGLAEDGFEMINEEVVQPDTALIIKTNNLMVFKSNFASTFL